MDLIAAWIRDNIGIGGAAFMLLLSVFTFFFVKLADAFLEEGLNCSRRDEDS